jgi:ribosomal protein L11 methylase PrmA
MSIKQAEYSIMELTVTDFDKDILSTLLFESGCSGIEECSDERWRIYFAKTLSARQQELLQEKLKKLNPSVNSNQLVFSTQPQLDWNGEWKKHIRPLRVTNRIWVAPPWELPQLKKGEMQLIIDPQMAFGTGSHESTQLMIQAMRGFWMLELVLVSWPFWLKNWQRLRFLLSILNRRLLIMPVIIPC